MDTLKLFLCVIALTAGLMVFVGASLFAALKIYRKLQRTLEPQSSAIK
jgi:hypothetical protein